MKVADLLERSGWTGKQLAAALGYSSAEAVNGRRRRGEDVPDAWYPRLLDLGLVSPEEVALDLYALRDGAAGDEGEAEEVREGPAPQPPPGAPRVEAAVQLDYRSVAGYIASTYRLSATFLVAPSDALLAQAITEHAEQAGQAWARWIESEPRVAAWLQRLMIGTPLGEVIGVHVAIVFAYTLARVSARELAASAAAAAAGGDGGWGAGVEAEDATAAGAA